MTDKPTDMCPECWKWFDHDAHANALSVMAKGDDQCSVSYGHCGHNNYAAVSVIVPQLNIKRAASFPADTPEQADEIGTKLADEWMRALFGVDAPIDQPKEMH